MPQTNQYTVTQTRQVTVTAADPEDAINEAALRWDDPKVPGAMYRVRVVRLTSEPTHPR